ncbi:Rrf2 family transcriptional regulator [Nocardia fluminea]
MAVAGADGPWPGGRLHLRLDREPRAERGVVDARRGRHGGSPITELGRDAFVGWLVRRLEGEGEVVECDGAHPCPLRTGCLLRSALSRAQEAVFTSLDTVAIEELTRNPTRTVLLALP